MAQRLVFAAPSLVVLCGPSGSGKSHWARRLFAETAVIDADDLRARICDDPRDQSVNASVFEMVRTLAKLRLQAGRVAVVDSQALTYRDRQALTALAQELGVAAHLVVFDADRALCQRRNAARGLIVPERVIERQLQRLAETKRSVRNSGEGFATVQVLSSEQADAVRDVALVTSTAAKLDVISDAHGCATELKALLGELGYISDELGTFRHPKGRLAVFVGDLVDHGPASLEVLHLVDRMVRAGSAAMGALGNHDWKLYRVLVEKRPVMVTEALQTTLDELDRAEEVSPGARQRTLATVARLFGAAPSHTVWDAGRLVVTHGGIRYGTQGARCSTSRRDPISMLNIYGEVDAGKDDTGKPLRTYGWVQDWPQEYTVAFGHDVMGPEPRALGAGNVIGLDTGCAYGGRLTALRWPERELVSVGAVRSYAGADEPALRGWAPDPLTVRRVPLADAQRQRPALSVLPGGAA